MGSHRRTARGSTRDSAPETPTSAPEEELQPEGNAVAVERIRRVGTPPPAEPVAEDESAYTLEALTERAELSRAHRGREDRRRRAARVRSGEEAPDLGDSPTLLAAEAELRGRGGSEPEAVAVPAGRSRADLAMARGDYAQAVEETGTGAGDFDEEAADRYEADLRLRTGSYAVEEDDDAPEGSTEIPYEDHELPGTGEISGRAALRRRVERSRREATRPAVDRAADRVIEGTVAQRGATTIATDDEGEVSADGAELALRRKTTRRDETGSTTTRRGVVVDTDGSSRDGLRAGVSLGRERVERTGEDEDGAARGSLTESSSTSATVSAAGVVRVEGALSTEVVGDDDGVSTFFGGGATGSIALGPDTFELGGTAHHERSGIDGTRTRDTASGSVDVTEGAVTAGATRSYRDSSGRETGSVGASGTLDLNSSGELEGVSGTLSAGRGPVSFALTGGYEVTAEDAERDGDQWTVAWTVRRHVGGSVRGRGSGRIAGASASVGARYEVADRGTQRFATEEAATDFRDHLPTRIRELSDALDSADSARDMAEGERRSRSESTSGTLGGSVELEGVELGATFGIAESHGISVVRRAGDVVDGSFRSGLAASRGFTLGAFGLSMGTTASDGDEHIVTVRFHLDQPRARQAYDTFIQGNFVADGDGVEYLHTDDVHTETDGLTLGVLGFSGSDTGTVAETRRRRADGRRETSVRGTSTSAVSGFGESSTAESSFEMTRDEATRERSYRMSSEVTGSSGESSQYLLGEATGTSSVGGDGRSSGTWTVSQNLSSAEVARFCERVYNPRNPEATSVLVRYLGSGGDTLLEGLRSAGSNVDAQALAVAAFVSEGGARAMDFVRREARATGIVDIALEGDRYLRGGDARRATMLRIRDYRRRVMHRSAEDTELAEHISGDLNGVRFRLAALEDRTRYTDLPEELRRREVERTQGWIADLESLLAQARTPPPEPATATAEAPPEESRTSGRRGSGSERSTEAPAPAATPAAPATESPARRELREVEAAHTRARTRVGDSRGSAWRDYQIQCEGQGVGMGSDASYGSAERRFGRRTGMEGMWGLLEDGGAMGSYAEARTELRAGEDAWRSAQGEERRLDRLRNRLGTPGEEGESAARELIAALRSVWETYDRADSHFGRSHRRFQEIRRRFERESPELFAGYRG